ncbi:MAG: hypothetical protein MNPFHGCM_02238 [Gemmatimonadaceae bacterium]|nr:hypothetical protein [Gemmatimonadaceae bacterium]
MRSTLLAVLASLATLGCANGLDPDAPILTDFTFAEQLQPDSTQVPYDSVSVASRKIVVKRAAFGSLCASRLSAGVTSSGSDVTLTVSQSPIATCATPAGLVLYLGSIQLVPGSYRFRVVERNASNPQGAVVIDKPVVVLATDT